MTTSAGGGAVRRWVNDLVFGFRLSVGGSRKSGMAWVRLGVGAIGVALAVGLLLGAASVVSMADARDLRDAGMVEDTSPRAGVSPTYTRWVSTDFRDKSISGRLLHGTGPTSPVPPGLAKLPKPGEMVVSPALAELLASPEGELLRPRFEGYRQIGTIVGAVLPDPGDLVVYIGADASIMKEVGGKPAGQEVYAYGSAMVPETMPPALKLLVALGSVALLVPVLMFVVSSTRIAGAERERRLSAIRLVGADAAQIRRISAAETLPPVLLGLLLGGAGFLIARPVVAAIRPMGIGVYPSDLSPSPIAVALIALLLPLGAIVVALASSRRTVVEPLGVVRLGKPGKRALWWRLLLIGAGVALLFFVDQVAGGQSDLKTAAVAIGGSLLLAGLAALLPWGVEASLTKVRGGAPSWQLAVRRLQMDGGTASRVVSGVVMVLAGAIALQITLVSLAHAEFDPAVGVNAPNGSPGALVYASETGDKGRRLAGVEGVGRSYPLYDPGLGSQSTGFVSVLIGDCAALTGLTSLPRCEKGDVFIAPERMGSWSVPPTESTIQPGMKARLRMWSEAEDGRSIGWTIPESARRLDREVVIAAMGQPAVLATPEAIGPGLSRLSADLMFVATGGDADAIEKIRNAMGPIGPDTPAVADSRELDRYMNEEQQMYASIRTSLLAGGLFVILVAAVSVLLLAVDQLRERRRALAAISASGVGFGTLARSLLWQNTVPMAVGVLLSIFGGTALAALVMRLTARPMMFDWAGVGLVTGAATVLVLLVTLLSLPALRAAISVRNLRTE